MAMDSSFSKFGDQSNADVKLQIFCLDGVAYEGNPIYLHSHVLKKSSYFEARLSKRWSPETSPVSEIILNLPLDGSPQTYIDCIRLMYSSYWKKHLSFLNVDDALRILPVASELLFEEGIQACMEYLDSIFWTPEQELKIRTLLSSLQLNFSTDLAERLQISKSLFEEKLELLRKTQTEMLSKILNKPFVSNDVSLRHMQETVMRQIVEYFQEDKHPAIQNICRDVLLNEIKKKIEAIKCESDTDKRDPACESLLWLLDLVKLCKSGIFEAAFTIFVEDEEIADKLAEPRIRSEFSPYWSYLDKKYSRHVLDILVCRFLDALANGDIIISKLARASFLIKWVPVTAYLICRDAWINNQREINYGHWETNFSERFRGGVVKILATLPFGDQSKILDSFSERAKRFETWEGGIFHWWINAMWMAVMDMNGSRPQVE